MNGLFNSARLHKIVSAPLTSFQEYGEVLDTGGRGQLVYIDRGASILGIAHLDSVGWTSHFDELRWRKGWTIFTEGLDDRLGAYILLELLPAMGINCDVLLTEDEESCNSTAQYFVPTKDYNWMFQFDRAGIDVVTYDYEDDELNDRLTNVGFINGWGSYSDICEMESLGIKGINFGTGYYDNHLRCSHMVVADTMMMVGIFAKF